MAPRPMRYFPLFADLAGARVLVVGGGEQAAQKVRLVRKTEAHLTVVADTAAEEIARLGRQGAISHIPRAFDSGDVQGMRLKVPQAGPL